MAMADYQAKPEVWKGFENLYGVHNPFNPIHSEFVDTILELRARVEKLEEAENDRRFRECMTTIKEATPEQIREAAGLPERSDLVERVGRLISKTVPTDEMFRNEAKAAIREVTAWLREQHDGDLVAATVLEREAERG